MRSICQLVLMTCILLATASAPEAGQIECEIQQHLDRMLAAANEHDTDRFLEAFEKSPTLVFTANDTTLHGWEALRTEQLKWWNYGKSAAEYTEIGDPIFHILGADLAITVQTLWMASRRPDGTERNAKLKVTSLWKKREEGWRIRLGHESFTRKP